VIMAPEVVTQHYTLSADMWSVGMVAYLLLTGRLPFASAGEPYAQGQASWAGGRAPGLRRAILRGRGEAGAAGPRGARLGDWAARAAVPRRRSATERCLR
jgi:serine/threonine protein kinase